VGSCHLSSVADLFEFPRHDTCGPLLTSGSPPFPLNVEDLLFFCFSSSMSLWTIRLLTSSIVPPSRQLIGPELTGILLRPPLRSLLPHFPLCLGRSVSFPDQPRREAVLLLPRLDVDMRPSGIFLAFFDVLCAFLFPSSREPSLPSRTLLFRKAPRGGLPALPSAVLFG